MMQEFEYRIENNSQPFFDLDVKESNFWVGVTDFSDTNQSLIFEFQQITLPEKLRFPFLRIINDKTILVIDSRTNPYNKNGWIVDVYGEVISNFFAGDAIQDVLVTKDFIVITYSDGEGVKIFDLSGKFLFNYGEIIGKKSVDVVDCYAAAFVNENQFIFYPYPEFPLVLFDIETQSQEVWEVPVSVHGSHAISKFDNKVYFHYFFNEDLEEYDFGIYEWGIGSKEVVRMGEFKSYLTRGLPNGRFLARSDSGYTIISLQ